MYRSFHDRVFAGVCGGLAASLRVNAWLVRGIFVVLSVISAGAFAALYVLLWWIVPQESAVLRRRRGVALPIVIVLIALMVAAWLARDAGYLQSATGADLFYPGVLLLLSMVFFLRQVRA